MRNPALLLKASKKNNRGFPLTLLAFHFLSGFPQQSTTLAYLTRSPRTFVDTSPEELAKIINVNVTATLRITGLIAPAMASRHVPLSPLSHGGTLLTHRLISKKGLILNVGSFAGATPTPLLAVYSGSKAFLRIWSDALALSAELAAPKGVVVEHANTYYVMRPRLSPPFPSPPPPLPLPSSDEV